MRGNLFPFELHADAQAELSSLLVNMKRESQLAVATYLRSAIWNWIDLFPHEFNEAIRMRGKMEGAPERVYDLLSTNIPHGQEKIYWPTLSILLCCTSEKIRTELVSVASGRRVYILFTIYGAKVNNSTAGTQIRRQHHEEYQ